jgi:hypothetical protein
VSGGGAEIKREKALRYRVKSPSDTKALVNISTRWKLHRVLKGLTRDVLGASYRILY